MDTMITVAGNLTADPVQRVTASGAIVVGMRLASSSRRFDRTAGEWRDGDVMYINVSCWRQLAGNVFASLQKGDGVLVHGRLSMRTYDDRQGVRRTVHEVDAVAIGPDLSRCAAQLRRPPRPAPEPGTVSSLDGEAATTDDGLVPEQPTGSAAEQPEVAA